MVSQSQTAVNPAAREILPVQTYVDGDQMGWTASLLFGAMVVVLFLISPLALGNFGFAYDLPEGPAWQKFHPGTYLAVLALAVHVFSHPRPGVYCKALCNRFPGAVYFSIFWILLTVYGVMIQKEPLTAPIETYLMGLVALLLVDALKPATYERLRWYIHFIILLDACVGIFEFATHYRLFRYIVAGIDLSGDDRPTAIFGHPLLNAASIGAYVLCLFMGGDPKLPLVLRLPFIAISMLALVIFGGRTALLMSLVVMALVSLKNIAAILMGARFTLTNALTALVILGTTVVGVTVAAYGGVFDAMIARFIDDNGSAEARVIALQMFDKFTFSELLFGPRQDLLVAYLKAFGISIGIENSWLAMMFKYGAIMTFFFMIGLGFLFWEIWRRSRPGVSLLFFYFFVIISSSIGVAAKTLIFDHFAVLLMFLFHLTKADASRAR